MLRISRKAMFNHTTYCGKHSPIEVGGGGAAGGAAPHDAMPQQPFGRSAPHVTFVQEAWHVMLQSDDGNAPQMHSIEAA